MSGQSTSAIYASKPLLIVGAFTNLWLAYRSCHRNATFQTPHKSPITTPLPLIPSPAITPVSPLSLCLFHANSRSLPAIPFLPPDEIDDAITGIPDRPLHPLSQFLLSFAAPLPSPLRYIGTLVDIVGYCITGPSFGTWNITWLLPNALGWDESDANIGLWDDDPGLLSWMDNQRTSYLFVTPRTRRLISFSPIPSSSRCISTPIRNYSRPEHRLLTTSESGPLSIPSPHRPLPYCSPHTSTYQSVLRYTR